MILFLHNRYRTTGGEERVVEDLLWLARERLGEQAELISRDSSEASRPQAALSLVAGGSAPQQVAAEVRRTGARVLHAHNLHPGFGWRSLAAGRQAGAAVVLHLHQYRLVCAVGVCFTAGQECTRCHGRNTLPGLVRNCRGSIAEALAYGASLSLWQRRILSLADAVIVPSQFALERLRELGAPIPSQRTHVLAPPLRALEAQPDGRPRREGYALVVSRLAPEKGVDVAIEACAAAGVPLLVAGDGPQRGALEACARRAGGAVSFAGQVSQDELAGLRAGAAIALVPSRSAETFGAAAAEAAAAGLPVAASSVGALRELLPGQCLVPAGDHLALAAAIERLSGDERAARQARERVASLCAPAAVAQSLEEVYERACAASGAQRT